MFDAKGAHEPFCCLCEGGPVAQNGLLQLDDKPPGPGLKPRTDDLPQFNIAA